MIEPLNDTVVIKPDEAETVTKGGVIIPGTADKDRVNMGTVVAVGPGKYEDGVFVETKLKKGEHVAYHLYPTGLNLELDRVKYKLLPEKQIMARVK